MIEAQEGAREVLNGLCERILAEEDRVLEDMMTAMDDGDHPGGEAMVVLPGKGLGVRSKKGRRTQKEDQLWPRLFIKGYSDKKEPAVGKKAAKRKRGEDH